MPIDITTINQIQIVIRKERDWQMESLTDKDFNGDRNFKSGMIDAYENTLDIIEDIVNDAED